MKDNYKRLIMANFLGFTITQDDGHRWINFDKTYSYSAEFIHEKSEEKGIWFKTTKVYGGVNEALDIIDMLLDKLGMVNLLEQFDEIVDIEWDIKYKSDSKLEERVGVIE